MISEIRNRISSANVRTNRLDRKSLTFKKPLRALLKKCRDGILWSLHDGHGYLGVLAEGVVIKYFLQTRVNFLCANQFEQVPLILLKLRVGLHYLLDFMLFYK